jgi:hypothetical protein
MVYGIHEFVLFFTFGLYPENFAYSLPDDNNTADRQGKFDLFFTIGIADKYGIASNTSIFALSEQRNGFGQPGKQRRN